MTMQVIAAVVEFKHELLVERTQSGLVRAKAEGKRLGRRPALEPDAREQVKQRLEGGAGVSELAREFNTTRQTIIRARAA